MGTGIKTWQIIDNKLTPVDTTMSDEGCLEYDLESWIWSNPEIIGTDIMIIGRQVETASGTIDLLGIDRSGNTVVIELKRGLLPRDALAQAIDYASDVAGWTLDRLHEICSEHKQKVFEEVFVETFQTIDLSSINFNKGQRIVLIGFSIEESLERMIEWLSDSYGVDINAVLLSYVKTKGNEEHQLLVKTSIIEEGDRTKDPDRQLRMDYWTAFLEFLKKHNSSIKMPGPTPWPYIAAPIIKHQASLGTLALIKSKKIAVRLYIGGPNATDCFKQLLDERDSIETQIGSQLIWKEAEKSKSITLFKDNVNINDRGSWPEQHQWLCKNFEAFYNAFAERIRNAMGSADETDEA